MDGRGQLVLMVLEAARGDTPAEWKQACVLITRPRFSARREGVCALAYSSSAESNRRPCCRIGGRSKGKSSGAYFGDSPDTSGYRASLYRAKGCDHNRPNTADQDF